MANVLIIEDDIDFRKNLNALLKSAGYEVIEAQNGKEGVRKYRDNPTDLVITDIFMPEKEGLETIMDIKTEFPASKIIAMSEMGKVCHHHYLDTAKTFGATKTLKKTIGEAELLSIVDDLLHVTEPKT